jgi:hypothetical protein
MTRGLTLVVGAALIAVAVTALALPPRAARAPSAPWSRDQPAVAGAFHVHSTRSDGSGSIDEVAAAASRAGLRFVVFTDHGDGTAAPEPPSYRSSVLCIDGVEISTSGGHYAVVGMQRAPYPLAGDPRDVVEDVRRLGGVGFVAHGDSPKADLRWTDWDAPFDGVEWLNLDTAWRAAGPTLVARALFTYWFRAPETVATLAARPNPMLDRIEMLNRSRPVLSIAGHDAHGLMAPNYEASFRALSTRVELPSAPSGDAAADARVSLDALRAGHHYTVIDGLVPPRVVRIVVGARPRAPTTDTAPAAAIESTAIGSAEWDVEHDPSSTGAIVRRPNGVLALDYTLGPGTPVAQFVALVRPVTSEVVTYRRLTLRAQADHPVRVALQLRAAGTNNPPRWQRSIYLDSTPREVTIRFAELKSVTPKPDANAEPLPAASIGALMLVLDTNNTAPGMRGSISFEKLAYER